MRGETLTLQQRENTINKTAWYSTNDSTKGPLTVLPVLENATSNWTNVNDQTYTMGTTVFKTNAYTGCTTIECNEMGYTLEERTGKARMITVQEANVLGCTGSNSTSTCPIWVYNYLVDSANYGGTVNMGTDQGYWTMSSALSVTTPAYARMITDRGVISSNTTSPKVYGARAVIVIDK